MTQNNGQAFRRARMMMAGIAAIINATHLSMEEKRLSIAAMPAYVSRGKGGGHNPYHARHGKHMDNVRKARRAHNKAIRGGR